MSSLYFVCGGPLDLEGALEKLFPDFKAIPDKKDLIWCGSDAWDAPAAEVAYIIWDNYWIISGDSNWVFRNGSRLSKTLSKFGRAGEFYGQSSAMFYEMVLYERSKEVERYFYSSDDPNGRKGSVEMVPENETLWGCSEKILPASWGEIYDTPGRWLTVPN